MKKDEDILFVPCSKVLSLDYAKNNPHVAACFDENLKTENEDDRVLTENSFMAIFLMEEKNNPNSTWKPWIDMLPNNFEDFPVFFSNT
jgi:histone-lysine N-methyltransferase SETD3